MKIQQTKHGQYFINLPKSVANGKGWIKGQELYIRFGPKGEVILEEK